MHDKDVAIALSASVNGGGTQAVASSSTSPSRPLAPSSAILDLILRNTPRAALPRGFEFLRTSPRARRLVEPPEKLQSLLEASFPIPQLIAAGVLAVNTAGQRQLSPIFGAGDTFFLRGTNGVFDDAFNHHGSVASSTAPWFALASCRRTRWNHDTIQVLICWNADDLQLLHRLGYYTIAGADLTQLTAAHINTVFFRSIPAANYFPYSFILIGSTLVDRSASVRPALQASIEHLLRLERVKDVDSASRFKIWLPGERVPGDVADAAAMQDRDRLRRLLCETFAGSLFSPAEAAHVLDNQQRLNFPAARRRLQRAVMASSFVPQIHRVRTALDDFTRAVHRELLADLEDSVLSTASPMAKLTAVATSDIAELYFKTSPLVRAAERILAGEVVHYQPGLQDEDLPQRLKLLDTIAKLTKATIN